jgi:hypothetical protein
MIERLANETPKSSAGTTSEPLYASSFDAVRADPDHVGEQTRHRRAMTRTLRRFPLPRDGEPSVERPSS